MLVVALEYCYKQTQLWKEFRPIVLLVVAIDLEVLFQSLLSLFSLSITFRIISGSGVKLHVQCISEGLEEVRYEFHTAIRSDVTGDTMLGENMETK